MKIKAHPELLLIPIILLAISLALGASLNYQKSPAVPSESSQISNSTIATASLATSNFDHQSSIGTTYYLVTITTIELVIGNYYLEINPGCLEFFNAGSSTTLVNNETATGTFIETTVTSSISTVVSTVVLTEGTEIGDGGCHIVQPP